VCVEGVLGLFPAGIQLVESVSIHDPTMLGSRLHLDRPRGQCPSMVPSMGSTALTPTPTLARSVDRSTNVDLSTRQG
jgi:hypothetical protein